MVVHADIGMRSSSSITSCGCRSVLSFGYWILVLPRSGIILPRHGQSPHRSRISGATDSGGKRPIVKSSEVPGSCGHRYRR